MPANSLTREAEGSVERERRRIICRNFKQKPLHPAGAGADDEIFYQAAGNAAAAPNRRDTQREDLALGAEALIEQHAARRAVIV